MKSVVKEWLFQDNISLKQQTVVLSALRGCDGQPKEDLSKKLTRMLRSAILYNAATPTSNFMKETMTLDEIALLSKNADKYPMHYYTHAMHACEIIGYKHPDDGIRVWFNKAYVTMVKALHLNPETESECDYRLRDGVDSD